MFEQLPMQQLKPLHLADCRRRFAFNVFALCDRMSHNMPQTPLQSQDLLNEEERNGAQGRIPRLKTWSRDYSQIDCHRNCSPIQNTHQQYQNMNQNAELSL